MHDCSFNALHNRHKIYNMIQDMYKDTRKLIDKI